MRYLTLLLCFLVINPIISQNTNEKIDAYISTYVRTGDFSGCVLISESDEISYKNCFGTANDVLRSKNTFTSKFLIGSISKQFTAAAILILEQKGLIQVEKNISEFFPDHPIASKITIHQLLTHTSGATDIFNIKGIYDEVAETWTIGRLSDLILKSDLDFEPGNGYSYSNGGYAILAHIIEKTSKMDYGAFLKKYLFDPLGMNNSGHSNRIDEIQDLSVGYDPIDFDKRIKTKLMNIELLKGSGSLYSTVDDLNLWINSLRSRSFLNADSYKKLLKNHGANYGYGISIYTSKDRKVFGHDGRINGYIADYLHYIEDNTSILILGNIQTGIADFFRQDIAAILFDESYSSRAKTSKPASKSPIDVSLIEGVYAFGPNFKVYVDYIDNRIMARANEGAYSELVALIDGRYFSRTLYSFIEFKINTKGQISKMLWTNNDGNSFEGTKE